MNDEEFYLLDLKSKFDKIKPNTYYLSYSGGKDSHFLYWFIKEYLKRDDIMIVGINTYMEHHEILKRILKNSDKVLIPDMKPMEIKQTYGIPCFSKTQDEIIHRYQVGRICPSLLARIDGKNIDGSPSCFGLSKKARKWLLSGDLHKVSAKCCECLKKKPAHKFQKESGLKPILGIRGTESMGRRAKYNKCFQKDGTFTPIWDLNDEVMEKIIEKYDIEVPDIYKNENIKRTGCSGCPYGSWKHDTEKELLLVNDAQFNFLCEYFKESYEVLKIDIEKIKRMRKELK